MALNFPNSPADGDVYEDFYYDATAGIWRKKLSVTTIGDLNDVTINTPLIDHQLVYNGNEWVNQDVTVGLESTFLLMGA